MEIKNLGQADGLPPVEWAAIATKLDEGSAPAAVDRSVCLSCSASWCGL